MQQATPPQSSSYPSSPSASAQNTMQSDRPPRPGPSSSFQAQMSVNQQQYPTNSRPNAMGSSHAYSRSSPAVGVEQKYIPFSSTTPDANKYPTSSRPYQPQTPTGAPSQSPLALADIRSSGELHMSDDLLSPNPYSNEAAGITQTNCNYIAPWAIYAYDWCNWPVPTGAGAGKMAICSHLEDPHNFIQILDTQVESNEVSLPGALPYSLDFTRVAEATCSYPVTRILWEPPSSQKQTTDLLATSGDHLRLWSLPASNPPTPSNNINRSASANKKSVAPQKLTPLALLSNSKTPEHTAPLTSLDWNKLSPKLIITSSIDTTCTIWDIPTLTAKTQLIAHDKEVFDVRFCAGSVDTFVSCGADGSVRMFDLRSLEHSTIIYEPSDKSEQGSSPAPTSPASNQQTMTYAPPLLRLAASPHDSHLLATFASDSRIIRILDHRQPGQALLELHGHSAQINSIEWSPSRRGVLASGADDSLVLSWDLINSQNSAAMSTVNGTPMGQPETSGANVKGPASSWRCDFEAGNLSWSPQSQLTSQGGDWLGVTGGRAVWGVKF